MRISEKFPPHCKIFSTPIHQSE